MTHPISRFPVPSLDEMPPDIAAHIRKVAEKSGFVPNIFLALAHRPDEFRAFFAYHDALMEREGGLTKAEREMIVVATSGANQCQYCVVAHGAILRIRARHPLIADQVAVNWRKADLSVRERAMLTYAEKVALRAQHIDEQDHRTLRDAGFAQDEIWDIGAIAAFFGMSNRLVNAGDIRPNDEFYMLGRT
ncbi:MAG: peroxidase-related enzyme [Paracoccus sp. (in: a-proteobacteria)]|uniref:peroxidase-related enzyme n=1 Tax=Paracoccus sp. TaxID=267 RepID=UPI0039E3A975